MGRVDLDVGSTPLDYKVWCYAWFVCPCILLIIYPHLRQTYSWGANSFRLHYDDNLCGHLFGPTCFW